MPGNTDKFMSVYKEYEQLLRAAGRDPKGEEDVLAANGDPAAERLRMCRQFRNYFAHVQDPGFIEPTDKMVKFVDERAKTLKLAGDPVKKHIKKPDACMLLPGDKASDAAAKFAKLKRNRLVVQGDDGSFTMLSIYDLVMFKPNAKVSAMKTKPVRPAYCTPDTAFTDLDPDKIWICTSDGTAGGKILGQVWF